MNGHDDESPLRNSFRIDNLESVIFKGNGKPALISQILTVHQATERLDRDLDRTATYLKEAIKSSKDGWEGEVKELREYLEEMERKRETKMNLILGGVISLVAMYIAKVVFKF